MKAGLAGTSVQQWLSIQTPRRGGHPRLTQSSLVFLWMVETIHHELCSDGEMSPARGRPMAHPAPPPLQSSRGSCSCNPAEPSKTISSIQSGIFQSFLRSERVTISAPVKLIRQRSKPAKNHSSAPSLPGNVPAFITQYNPVPPSTTQHTAGCIVGLRCTSYKTGSLVSSF